MLERCPFYGKCSANTRYSKGNNEYYCIGTINWEFCQEFQDKVLAGASIRKFGRDKEVKRIAYRIYKRLGKEIDKLFHISLIADTGEIFYYDRHILESYLFIS
ncbi:MAG: hypothetical protein ACTSYB_04030 [Candidatus Helarchaeota archaeon]